MNYLYPRTGQEIINHVKFQTMKIYECNRNHQAQRMMSEVYDGHNLFHEIYEVMNRSPQDYDKIRHLISHILNRHAYLVQQCLGLGGFQSYIADLSALAMLNNQYD